MCVPVLNLTRSLAEVKTLESNDQAVAVPAVATVETAAYVPETSFMFNAVNFVFPSKTFPIAVSVYPSALDCAVDADPAAS